VRIRILALERVGQLDAGRTAADRELVTRPHRDQVMLQRRDQRLRQGVDRSLPPLPLRTTS
jgi:hypothetical protein